MIAVDGQIALVLTLVTEGSCFKTGQWHQRKFTMNYREGVELEPSINRLREVKARAISGQSIKQEY
jgi:hypothetical protein